MTSPTTTTASAASTDDLVRSRGPSLGSTRADTNRSQSSGVSWGAIAAGAAAAAALSLILLILGVGLGLSSVSPWAREGVSATTFGVSTMLWLTPTLTLTLTQLLASAMGGYLAERLRTKWADLHTDEVYFRDTAHGFLAWAVASLATAAVSSSATASIVSRGVQAGGAFVGGAAGTASAAVGGAAAAASGLPAQGSEGEPMGFFVDSLFRRTAGSTGSPFTPFTPFTPGTPGTTGTTVTPGTPGTDTSERPSERGTSGDTAEAGRSFLNVLRGQPLPADDARYVGQIVAQRTGLSQTDAEPRVADVDAKAQVQARGAEVAARAAADKVRKAPAYSALWLFVSLLVGAFCASLAATFGGRRREA